MTIEQHGDPFPPDISSPATKSNNNLHDPSSHSTSSSVRIASGASTLDEEKDSTGGDRILFSKEKATDIFAGNLFSYLCSKIWKSDITLDWVKGRNGDTCLAWANSS